MCFVRRSLTLTAVAAVFAAPLVAQPHYLVADVNRIAVDAGSTPDHFVTFGGAVYFNAADALHGEELWRSDGTEAGTIPVIDLKPGGGSFPGYFRVFQKRLFFSADGGKGFEPWVSDGTTEGTISLGDLNPTGSSYARHCQRRHRRRHPPRDRRRSHQRHPTVLSHQSG
jgi:ELWxxDGT repeat protein